MSSTWYELVCIGIRRACNAHMHQIETTMILTVISTSLVHQMHVLEETWSHSCLEGWQYSTKNTSIKQTCAQCEETWGMDDVNDDAWWVHTRVLHESYALACIETVWCNCSDCIWAEITARRAKKEVKCKSSAGLWWWIEGIESNASEWGALPYMVMRRWSAFGEEKTPSIDVTALWAIRLGVKETKSVHQRGEVWGNKMIKVI